MTISLVALVGLLEKWANQATKQDFESMTTAAQWAAVVKTELDHSKSGFNRNKPESTRIRVQGENMLRMTKFTYKVGYPQFI